MQSLVLTLVGSARFEEHFKAWNRVLTLSGHCVFSLGAYTSDLHRGYTDKEKELLDRVHLEKISRSDGIVLFNVGAYIGPSALRQVNFATTNKKRLFALESWGEGHGVGPDHMSSLRAVLESRYKVPRGFASPISTSKFRHVWDPDLLGEGGTWRSSLVDFIHAMERKAGFPVDI